MDEHDFHKISRELLIETTLEGIITKVSPNCLYIIGYSQDQMLGQDINQYSVGQTDMIKESLENVTLMSCSGLELHFDMMKVIKETVLLSLINISDYNSKYYRAMRLLKMFERTNDILYSFDVKEMRFTYLSPSIKKNLGYSVEEHIHNPMLPFEITHPEEIDLMMAKIGGEFDYSKPAETKFRHKLGHYLWFEDYVTPVYSDGELVAIEGITRNIQDRKELELKLKFLSLHDGLTGLYNRTQYEIRKEQLDKEKNQRVGLVLCDLDNLKVINDTRGHDKGDQLLKLAAKLLNQFVNNGLLARIGGDEFSLLLEEVDKEDIAELIGKIKTAIQNHNACNPELPVHLSVGSALVESSIGKMNLLFEMADEAMYKDKLYNKKLRYYQSANQ